MKAVQAIISVQNGIPGNPEYHFASPLNLEILEGEQVAIVGDNAAGKTRLVEVLYGKIPLFGQAIRYDFAPSTRPLVSENIRYIAFRDAYSGSSDGAYYMQQRWNHADIDEATPTLRSSLALASDPALRDRLLDMFALTPMLDKYVISLSSGELRKFQLIKMLMLRPRVLILDNPFIGLDAATRAQLSELLDSLVRSLGILVILVLSRTDVLPGFITHIISVEGLQVLPKVKAADYRAAKASYQGEAAQLIESIPQKDLSGEAFYPKTPDCPIVRFNDICVRYFERTIINHLDWTVKEGECWALSGENGAGKSTLLALVCADSPQGYACDIDLFGHKRGTGETIWEIKRHIGYMSPEMHRGYLKNIPARNIVASGFFDTVGLFRTTTPEQDEVCMKWMRIFGIDHLAEKSYLKISSGEQRLCLLARAFVKDPELLILDEPMHGLDENQCEKVRTIIDAFMRRDHKTLVMVSHFESEYPSCISNRLFLKKNI